jgi:23S rRNA (uracil1939-C5)-methyltransferase
MNNKNSNNNFLSNQSSLECLRLSSDGSGVGYNNGVATFVQGLLPGETGEVQVYKSKKKWQRARLINIVKRSPQRVEAPCTVFKGCGGCRLQHITYQETLHWKQIWVKDALLRIGKVPAEVKPAIGMPFPWRYRNKARLHRNFSGKLGYYREKTNDLVHFSDCLLLSERMNRWISLVQELLADGYPEIHTLTFRENTKGEGLLLLEGQPSPASTLMLSPEFAVLGREGLCTVWGADSKGVPKLLWGDDEFTQKILGLTFKVSPRSFLQVNSLQMDVLYTQILNWANLTEKDIVWDLYSGIGTLTLILASIAGKVTGIEENPFAIEDAIQNAVRNNFMSLSGKVEFLRGKVESQILKSTEKPDVVILDPPRAGIHPFVGQRLLELKPQRLIYVSCDPGTLARDLGLLTRGGYSVECVQPVDMFPWTGHVETVVKLYRG